MFQQDQEEMNMPTDEVDTRPLHEKLADHIQPASFTLDLSAGNECVIIGNGHDIERVRAACKEMLKRIESDQLGTDSTHTIYVPAREAH